MSQYAPSPREQEVLALLLAGHEQHEIADRLSLSRHTVGHHLTRLRRIYGASTTIALIALIRDRREAELAKQLAECERVRAALDRRGRS